MNRQDRFDSEANARSHDYDVLTSLFGDKLGKTLYGGAIKVARNYNVALDDVIQELAIAASEVTEEFGFLHINTALYRARDAITKTYAYGVNRYYARKGVTVASYDKDSSGSGDDWRTSFADEGFDWDNVDLALDVRERLAGLDETDRTIADGLASGRRVTEIADDLGIHYSAVIRRRDRHLAPAFAGLRDLL